MKTRIIDIFNKIVNKEEIPQKIIYAYCEYEFIDVCNDYINKDGLCLFEYLFKNEENALEKEVEIVEDKPTKLPKMTLLAKEIEYGSMSNWLVNANENEEKIASAIDEIGICINDVIDRINNLSEKSEK